MRISEALSKSRDLVIDFETASLNVTYRPVSYTLEELDELQAVTEATGGDAEARRERMNRLTGMISRLVVTWDLTDADEHVINPQDADALRQVPMNVFTEILSAVRRDQQVGEAQRPSDAG